MTDSLFDEFPERIQRHAGGAFKGTMRGRNPLASPLIDDPFGRPTPQVSLPGSKPQVHSLTADFTADQDLDGVSDPVEMSDQAEDPLRKFGWQADDPGTTVVALVPGVLRIGLWWRWGFLDGDESKGRFRTPSKVRVARTRAGTVASVTFEDARPRPGIDPTTLPDIAVRRGDEFDLTLLHDAGEDRGLAAEDAGGVTWSLWETAPGDEPPDPPTSTTVLALAEEDATNEDWLVTIGTADGTVTKVGQWDTTDAQPNNFSGFDIDGASGWSKMTDNVGAHPQVMAQLALADGSQTQVVPSQGASTPDWSNAAAAGTAVGGGLLWTVDASPQVAHRVDMSDGSDDGEQALSLSSGSLSVVYRCLYHDGTLYAVVTLDDNDDYLLGFNPSTGAETSRVGLSAVVTEGVPVGLARDSAGRWWLLDESGSAGFLRQFDESTGAEVASVQVSTGDWFVYGMAFS